MSTSKSIIWAMVFEVSIIISISIYRVPTVFHQYFKIYFHYKQQTQKSQFLQGRELIIKDTELSHRTSSRAGQDVQGTQNWKRGESEGIQGLLSLHLNFISTSVPLFYFSAYQLSPLLAPVSGKHPLLYFSNFSFGLCFCCCVHRYRYTLHSKMSLERIGISQA